ncbi:phospholipase effector Tle1 domain-containing protein [Reichenbachiella sp.]
MRKSTYNQRYEKDHHAEEKERKHIVLLDGTWNDETGLDGSGLVTNIVQLSRIFINKPDKQIVRYHRGVGNDNDNKWLSHNWKGADGKAVGLIVERAYARLVQDWQSGDRIYIFGFSRGAAAARLLASKINREGIPKGVEITLKPVENRETKVVEQRIHQVNFDRSASKKIDIEFLGVWDTVSALGLFNNILATFKLRKTDLFTDQHIATNIQQAVHLVSIDETRNSFRPSLMNHKEGVTHEVWFPGVHSDIGGTYLEKELSQANLYYMIDKLSEWNEARKLDDFLIDQNAYAESTKSDIDRAHFHFQGHGFGKSLREIVVQMDGKKAENLPPKIHQLYHDIASRRNSYSVVEVKKWFSRKSKRITNFQYMPFNVKVLDGEYDVVG